MINTRCGALVVGRFVDDFGNDIVPSSMSFEAYMARHYFYGDYF